MRDKVKRKQIEIIPALPEQEPVLANLLELYAHDFSEFMDQTPGADGRFGYKHLPLYWKEEGRYPFLVRVDDRLAGFVFVRKGPGLYSDGNIWDMAEFFIVRGSRRQGIGLAVAHKIWKMFPGRWQVRVMDKNRKAQVFWERAVAAFCGETVAPLAFEQDGQSWQLFSFEVADGA